MLKPWLQGPLDLADDTVRYSPSWSELQLNIHLQTANIPVVVLPAPPYLLSLALTLFSFLGYSLVYWRTLTGLNHQEEI